MIYNADRKHATDITKPIATINFLQCIYTRDFICKGCSSKI